MRVVGLASGMDVDTIVKDLMKAERIPLNKLKQKKQVLEWKRDDYRAINTLLFNFRKEVTNMKLSTSYRAKTTSSTNDALLSATATPAAGASSYQVSNVTQLATAAFAKSAGKVNITDPAKSLQSISGSFSPALTWKQGNVETQKVKIDASNEVQLKLEQGMALSSPLSVKVNGKEVDASAYTVDALTGKIAFTSTVAAGSDIEVNYVTDKKVENLSLKKDATGFQLAKGAINSQSLKLDIDGTQYTVDTLGNLQGGTLQGKVDFQTGQVTLNQPLAADVNVKAEYTQSYSTFQVETNTSTGPAKETFYFTGNQSFNDVMNKVNASNVGVTMFYDSFSDQISVTRKETGTFGAQDLKMSGGLMDSLLLSNAVVQAGQNAKFEINGLATERTSNTFTMNGVTMTLKQTFTEAVSVNVATNTTEVFDNIKGFVDKYNELIDAIQKKTSEERNRKYLPLTDEERDALSDKEAEKWENIAKTGHLRNDPLLTGVLTSMRTSFSGTVSTATGKFKHMSDIGIKTTANYMEGGKLEIDEKKLKQALEDDPAGVESLFTSAEGIMSKLQDSVSSTYKKLQDKAGSSFSTNATFVIGRNLTDMNRRINRFETRMKQVETRYYSQFTAMEKAIQKANSQSGYLSQMFTTG